MITEIEQAIAAVRKFGYVSLVTTPADTNVYVTRWPGRITSRSQRISLATFNELRETGRLRVIRAEADEVSFSAS